MDRDVERALRRWIAADQADLDAEADGAFRAVFQVMPRQAPRPGFVNRVAAAVGTLARPVGGRSTPWSWSRRAAVAALAVIGTASMYFATVALAPIIARRLVALVSASVRGFVWVVMQLQSGLDLWAILAEAGRAIGAAIATPQVAIGLVAIELVSVVALYALHRLLTLEKESS